MIDPWGIDEPPARHEPLQPLPPRLARMARLTAAEPLTDEQAWAAPRTEELPEVAALMAEGFRPLEPDGLSYLLPAVWPRRHRCWVPDRRPLIVHASDSVSSWVAPVSPAHSSSLQAQMEAEQAAEAGLPPAPVGRIWMLRSPWRWIGLRVVLSVIFQRCAELDGAVSPAGFATTGQELLAWDEIRLRAWWTGDTSNAAGEWESVGRVGEDVADLVWARVRPEDVRRLIGLTEPQCVRWCEAVGITSTSADRVAMWRALGFPAEPPEGLYRFEDWTAEEITSWLDAGFDVPEMLTLMDIPLAAAISWRQHGYESGAIRTMLGADESMTPEEADAFAQLDIPDAERISWIEYGFSAADAARYRPTGVQPNQARVWRSRGLGPGDVRPGEELPPGYERGAWIGPSGTPLRDMEHFVSDPPGTRGRKAVDAQARRRRHRP